MTITKPRDEPTKLAEIVVPLLGPNEAQKETLRNGCRIDLAVGALDQDDCAAYHIRGEMMLVAGSDYVRGPKFRLYEMGLLGNYEIGWYLAGANWSDVAAMGAVPLGLLSVIRYPKELLDQEFERILQGVADCCAYVGARNVGGDIGGAERIILSASAFGAVEPDGILRRNGATPGDLLCITGPTGLAGAAMQLAAAGKHAEVSGFDILLQKWRRVEPRILHGRLFSLAGVVTACLDTSDGLKGAIETIGQRSGVRIEVNEELVPITKEVQDAAAVLGVDPLVLTFGDSVDFELLCTVSKNSFPDLKARCLARGLDLIQIGRVTQGVGCALVAGGADRPLPGEVWRHQEHAMEQRP